MATRKHQPPVPPTIKLAADIQVTGGDAATTNVRVVARSSNVINGVFGPEVMDFSGMRVNDRIPLDYNHDDDDSIGYLDTFDTSTGNLICDGVIVMVDGAPDGDEDDDIGALVAKMRAKIPYQASIQFDCNDLTLEFVPGDASTSVNGVTVDGPVTVVREWTLMGVAICKFGCDPDTSSVVLSKSNKRKGQSGGGYFVRYSKTNKRVIDRSAMSDSNQKNIDGAIDATVPMAPKGAGVPDSPAANQGKVDEVQDDANSHKHPEDVKAVPTATGTDVGIPMTDSAKMSRDEFNKFVTTFGNERAAIYYSQGKVYSDALAEHVKAQNEQIAELTKRLNTLDRGASQPVKMSRVEENNNKKQGLADLIRMPGAAK